MLTHIAHPNPKKRPKMNYKIQDGRRPPIWKTLNAMSLQPFDWFWGNLVRWCILALPNCQTGVKAKIEKFQKWRTAAILKIENRDISKTVWPILMKFYMMAHINPPEVTSWSENQTFKNPRWRTAAILKNVEYDISATVWPILDAY